VRANTGPKRRKVGNANDFAEAARLRHSDRYDYSLVQYRNSSTPVQIVCAVHGVFTQSPSNHLAGKGCRKCATEAAKQRNMNTTEQFICKARERHGEKYDYSLVEYGGAHQKVIILCAIHGAFHQAADAHLNSKVGCPACGRIKVAHGHRWSAKEFTDKAVEKFGTRFDYGRSIYVNALTPVEILCALHGPFFPTPASHLHRASFGCPSCARENKVAYPVNRDSSATRLQLEEFLARARQAHGDKYDYTDVKLVDSKCKITINCSTHGAFHQMPSKHLAGDGCKQCGSESTSRRQRQPASKFIARARELHGAKFDYSLVRYRTARTPVTIVCPKHGAFDQPPDRHLKYGCRQCADEALPGAYTQKRFHRDPILAQRLGTLYYVQFTAEDGESFFKVGISNGSAEKRFAGYAGSYGYRLRVLASRALPLAEAHAIEQHILKGFVAEYRYVPLKRSRNGRRFGGSTECFCEALPTDLLVLLSTS
jgi:hypothetical protein